MNLRHQLEKLEKEFQKNNSKSYQPIIDTKPILLKSFDNISQYNQWIKQEYNNIIIINIKQYKDYKEATGNDYLYHYIILITYQERI